MGFSWEDYQPAVTDYVEDWLDEAAVKFTGLDDGFRAFYEYWAGEDDYIPGENFWAKVVFDNEEPFAVVALAEYEGKVTIMEIVIAPEKRGRGMGTKMLQELLAGDARIGFPIRKCEAVIFPDNIASQRAFEKSGFSSHHTYEDGSAVLYSYEK
jgi:RimJ/RimL family protein N-acetyltransferase